jgi:hypothetical protein
MFLSELRRPDKRDPLTFWGVEELRAEEGCLIPATRKLDLAVGKTSSCRSDLIRNIPRSALRGVFVARTSKYL